LTVRNHHIGKVEKLDRCSLKLEKLVQTYHRLLSFLVKKLVILVLFFLSFVQKSSYKHLALC